MANEKNWWTAQNVRAYLVFQPLPDCFTGPQWTEWKKYAGLAASGVGNNGGGPTDLPPHCGDCTREFQADMRVFDRCAHPEVKFIGPKAYLDPDRPRN